MTWRTIVHGSMKPANLSPAGQMHEAAEPLSAASYDGFISYSHAADSRVAGALQRELERFAKGLFQRRALHLFRDETNLSVNPGLWPAIVAHLGRARFLLLVCDPSAAASKWVTREVQWWLENRSAKSILLIVTGGAIAWSESARDFDWTVTDCAPRVLARAFPEEPFFIDLRWARGEPSLTSDHTRFRSAVLNVAARLHGKSPDELDGEAVRAHRRFRVFTASVIAAIGVLGAAATGLWLSEQEQRRLADRNAERARKGEEQAKAQENFARDESSRARRAEAQALANEQLARQQRDRAAFQSRLALSRQAAALSVNKFDTFFDQAFLLAAQAYAFHPTSEARSVLLHAGQLALRNTMLFAHEAQITALAFSADGTTLASADAKGNVFVWRGNSRTGARVNTGSSTPALSFCDVKQLVTAQLNGSVMFWDIAAETPRLRHETSWPADPSPEPRFPVAVRCLPEGKGVVAVNTRGRIAAWNLASAELFWQGGAAADDRAFHSGSISSEGEILLTSNVGMVSMWKVGQANALWMRDMPDVRKENQGMAVRIFDTWSDMGIRMLGERPDEAVRAIPVRGEFVNPFEIAVLSKERVRLLGRKNGEDARAERAADFSGTLRLQDLGQVRRIAAAPEPGFMASQLILAAEAGAHSVALRPPLSVRELKGRRLGAIAAAVDRTGKRIAVGYVDGSIALWDTPTRHPQEREISIEPNGKRQDFYAAAVDRAGSRLAIAAYQKLAIVNLAAEPARTDVLPWHYKRSEFLSDEVNVLGFDASGGVLAVGSREGRLQLWDLAKKALAREFGEPAGPGTKRASVMEVAFLHGGRRLIAARKGTLEIWDIASGKPLLHPAPVHKDWITLLHKSADDSHLVSASRDRRVIFWDVRPDVPQARGMLTAHAIPSAAAFVSGSRIAIGYSDGRVLMWDVPKGQDAKAPPLWAWKSELNLPIRDIKAIGDELYVVHGGTRISILDPRTGFAGVEIPSRHGHRLAALAPNAQWMASHRSAPSETKRNEELVVFDLNFGALARLACAAAGRTLSNAEWRQFFGGEFRYTPACRDRVFAPLQVVRH